MYMIIKKWLDYIWINWPLNESACPYVVTKYLQLRKDVAMLKGIMMLQIFGHTSSHLFSRVPSHWLPDTSKDKNSLSLHNI